MSGSRQQHTSKKLLRNTSLYHVIRRSQIRRVLLELAPLQQNYVISCQGVVLHRVPWSSRVARLVGSGHVTIDDSIHSVLNQTLIWLDTFTQNMNHLPCIRHRVIFDLLKTAPPSIKWNQLRASTSTMVTPDSIKKYDINDFEFSVDTNNPTIKFSFRANENRKIN